MNAGAAHILEDEKEGTKLRHVVNVHITDRWSHYGNKIGFPYKRQNGVKGEWVEFDEPEDYLKFISDAKKVTYFWTDYEELHVIANLYQINIKVITVKGNDDKNPKTNIIGPDPALESFSLLPPGKVPDMTLLHYDNAHFDLIVSKHSRLTENVVPKSRNEQDSKELMDLKEKYEKLKIAYTESLVKIEKLSSKVKKDEQIAVEEVDNQMEHIEEDILLSSKKSGFLRDNPQYQPQPKPMLKSIECEFCEKRFDSNNQLKKQMQDHGTDGDWNCDECHYQTNEKSNLSKHIDITKHSSKKLESTNKQKNKFACNFCVESFISVVDLTKHRTTHKTFKPCKNLPNCQYKNDCIFNHEKIENNNVICYECGQTFNTLKEVMPHRKANHKMNKCSKFMKNECKFNDSNCWYRHDAKQKSEKNKMEIQSPVKADKATKATEPSGFWEPPANLAPPSIIPSQAAWMKMTAMMKELNQMMSNMRHHSQPFQSL